MAHDMTHKVLHILSQRPSLTGSGVTLEAAVRHAGRAGWDQEVVCGVPVDDPEPEVGGLEPDRIHPLVFETEGLDFPVPGMSDVMPYPSTVFSQMTPAQVEAYVQAWRRHISTVVSRFEPDLVHTHHVWLMSSILKDVAPATSAVTQCHATGLRQMKLCQHLAEDVRKGCRRNERFLVQNPERRIELAATLDIPVERVHVVGAGFREDLFHCRGRDAEPGPRLVYVGKYARAKGLPWLLDAVERLAESHRGLELHVAGSGAGTEAEGIEERMRGMEAVTLHGQLGQGELADLMRTCSVMVLPSFYEGVPLVLVEAAACGCRTVSTRLQGVVENLVGPLGDALALVDMPRLTGVDTPEPGDLPTFVENLAEAVDRALSLPAPGDLPLEPLTWKAVFGRIEAVWTTLLHGTQGGLT
ncbi:MAG: glycosyltransferase family 4 protein [Deltaproteobacteria bacterium]|nr:glycosyltransferase family 4 protein [Deltaproteobacteria bacterium]